MSDSRIDYQPLHIEALDSPPYHHSTNPPDTPGHQYTPPRERAEDDEDDAVHATETQELVSPQRRGFAEQRGWHQEQHQDENDDETSAHTGADRAIRLQAFFCAALLGVSTHYTRHMTGPLKDVLRENVGITNTQFSMLQSSLSLFPTLMPLIGGLLVERYGTGPSSIVFTSIVILGQVVVVLGCWARSIKFMIAGFCLFGLGAAPITIIQETIWIRYFKKNGLALVMALGLTSGKLSGFLALATTVPLTALRPFGFVTPFLISLGISIFAWFMNIMFLMLQKKPKEGADAMTKITILLKSKRTHLGWREVYGFSTMLWTLLTISFLVGASWSPFIHQASNIVKHRYRLSDEQAAWESSVILAIPPIIYPFLGTFIDHAGKRAWLLVVNAGLLIGTYLILLTPYSSVPIPPTVPMLLFSMSLSIGTLSILTSVPILTKHVPTGLGLHRSIDSIGATLFGTVAGMLQDSTNGEDEISETESIFDQLYNHFFPAAEDLARQEHENIQILGMFLSLALVMLIACLVFVWGDYHWTDGEGGKTGLINGVFGNRGSTQETTPSHPGRSHRRRSTEVMQAMTMEPLFELEDGLDAEELSETEMGATSFHSNRQEPATRLSETSNRASLYDQRGYEQSSRHQDQLHAASSRDDDDSQDEDGEPRFNVRIESGDDDIPKHKIVQAHFWIMVWTVLLVFSWVVFGIGMTR